jgi:hypothetical protein
MAQRRCSASPNTILNLGIVLFCLSFILPSGHAAFVPTLREHANDYLKPFGGFWAFVNTPAAITFMPLWRGPPINDHYCPGIARGDCGNVLYLQTFGVGSGV